MRFITACSPHHGYLTCLCDGCGQQQSRMTGIDGVAFGNQPPDSNSTRAYVMTCLVVFQLAYAIWFSSIHRINDKKATKFGEEFSHPCATRK